MLQSSVACENLHYILLYVCNSNTTILHVLRIQQVPFSNVQLRVAIEEPTDTSALAYPSATAETIINKLRIKSKYTYDLRQNGIAHHSWYVRFIAEAQTHK